MARWPMLDDFARDIHLESPEGLGTFEPDAAVLQAMADAIDALVFLEIEESLYRRNGGSDTPE